MFTSLSPSSITSRSRAGAAVGVVAQAQAQAPPSPFAFSPDTETLYADPWHARTLSLATPTWSPESHTSHSNSSSEHSSPTPTSPGSVSEHERETSKKSTREKKSTYTNPNPNPATKSSKSKKRRSKSAAGDEDEDEDGDGERPKKKMVMGKTGKPILAASLKRQLRRQKARARAEPKYIELADGQKLGLGQRRSKYTAILEKLNQDLARVQNELVQEKQRNQQLDETVQQLSQQLNQQTSPPSPSTKLQSYPTALQIKSQLMHQHSTQSIHDFFKMSSPVMLVLLDFNLRVIDANQTFLRENGWRRDELIGRRLPIVHMCMFFIPGYDPKQIPIDENDIPPLHGGLPRGVPVEEIQANPANFPVYHNLYRGKAESITVRDTYLDGKGRLYKSAITHWLAYYKPEDDNNNNNNLPGDTARFASDIHTRAMRSGSGSGSASSYVYSRPSTAADEAFRDLFGKPNPPYLSNKGYPKYQVAMESAYDREYLHPISLSTSSSSSSSSSTSSGPLSMWNSFPSSSIREVDTESDSDDEHLHLQDQNVMPWTDTTPLHTIAKIADRLNAWRRTLRANRAATSTSAIDMNPSTATATATTNSSNNNNSPGSGTPVPSPLDDFCDEDLILPSVNPACAASDACAIVSVLVEKAKKVTSIRKMVKKEEIEEPVMEEEGDGNYCKSTTAISIATIDTIRCTPHHLATATATATATTTPEQRSILPQVQVPVPISIPVHTPIQTSQQPSTPFPPSPSPYSPLDLPLPLSLPTPTSSFSSCSSSIPPVYDSDPDMWTCFPPSIPLTTQSSYESQTRTTFPFRAPSPFSIWGN